jgi:hypothetical protein
MVTEEMRIAERHRRYQLNSADRRIERMRYIAETHDEDVQDSATMRLALWSMTVGSHAHRGTPV